MINVGNICAMNIKDVNAVVKVHLSSFQGFFLTFLGHQFLGELYAGIIADSTGIAYVYREEARVLGFVAGTSQPAGFYSRLLHQRWWRFALASLMPVLKKPLIILRLSQAFRKPQDVSNQPDTGTLMSVAVAPETQGHGLGQALVKAFRVEAQQRGCRYVNLTTDALDNEAVNAFYQHRGFHLARKFETPEKRLMNEYMIAL